MKHFEKWKWALYIISLIIPLWKATAVRNGHTQWEPRWGKPFFSLLFPLTGLMSGEWPSVLTCKQMFKGVSTSIYGWLSEWKRSSCMCTYFHSAANGGSHANTVLSVRKKKCVHIYIQKVHHEGKFSRIQHTQCVSVLHTDVCDKILGFDSMAIRPSCRIRKKITKG